MFRWYRHWWSLYPRDSVRARLSAYQIEVFTPQDKFDDEGDIESMENLDEDLNIYQSCKEQLDLIEDPTMVVAGTEEG